MANRVTQQYLETMVVYVSPPNARVTSNSIDTLFAPTSSKARVTSSNVDVLWANVSVNARVTNVEVSVLVPSSLARDNAKLRTIPETKALIQMGGIY